MLQSGSWREASDTVVQIERDGELFKFVHDYMFYGNFPRNHYGFSLVVDASLLKAVKQEADFYQLPGLVKECNELLHTCEAEHRIDQYSFVKRKIGAAINNAYASSSDHTRDVVFQKDGPNNLITLLRSSPYAPAWVTGTLNKDCNAKIFMSTTVQNVNVLELIASAVQSPFGKGAEMVLDKNVRDSVEIPASNLCDLKEIIQHINISSLAPNMKLELKPYKLVVYQEGGHFDSHRDTVRDEHHIGTLVLILNSEYAGGELEVCHGEHNLSVSGALKWVAMYGDCVHKIHQVTSGTRVSLIFDIWSESNKTLEINEKDEHENYYIEEFWRSSRRLGSIDTLTPTLGLEKFWERIHAAIDKELEQYATVSICLEHLYPACQADPNFLKGGDARLYFILKDKYSLAVTSLTLARVRDQDTDGVGYYEFDRTYLLDSETNVLFIPNAMNENDIIFQQEEIEFTGNESQAQELVYLVAALVVRKK